MSTFKGFCRDLNKQGEGVVLLENDKIAFVPGVLVGEKVSVQIIEDKKTFCYGQLVEILEASEHRRTPPCSHQGFSSEHCGSCSWMIMNYSEQIRVKLTRFKRILENLNYNKASEASIVPSTKELEYRQVARVQFDENGQMAYKAFRSSNIVAVNDCKVIAPRLKNAINNFEDKVSSKDFSFGEKGEIQFFKQANGEIDQKVKQWVTSLHEKKIKEPRQLLELLCGNGNFTRVLKPFYKDLFCVENSKLGL